MGHIVQPQPVKLIASIFAQECGLFRTVEKNLSRKFGPIDFESPLLDFNNTRYYEEEFGANLKRKLISFKKLIRSEAAWKIKIATNAIEEKFSKNGKRRVNIDPGYLTQANLILASSKMFCHRIHANKGIHQEVTLTYQDKTFKALPWTYPDYQSSEHIAILLKMRAILASQLREKQKR